MPTINDLWIRPIVQYTKTTVFFTMFITGLLTYNVIGFALYFVGYQVASLVRLGIYNIIYPESYKSNPLTYTIYDYSDVVTFITNNKVPMAIYLPLYAISYTMSFIVYTFRNPNISLPQIVIGSLLLIYMICYLLTVYMVTSPFKILPYVEIMSGFGIGLLVNYLISTISTSSLFFNSTSPKRKRLICRKI